MEDSPTPITRFQEQVYAATRCIPPGSVTTYRILAEAIGCRSSRAVGQALRRNPFAPEVPCHRVIRSDFTLGGFAGRTEGPELDRKSRMLIEEGVAIEGGRLVDPSQLYRY